MNIKYGLVVLKYWSKANSPFKRTRNMSSLIMVLRIFRRIQAGNVLIYPQNCKLSSPKLQNRKGRFSKISNKRSVRCLLGVNKFSDLFYVVVLFWKVCKYRNLDYLNRIVRITFTLFKLFESILIGVDSSWRDYSINKWCRSDVIKS